MHRTGNEAFRVTDTNNKLNTEKQLHWDEVHLLSVVSTPVYPQTQTTTRSQGHSTTGVTGKDPNRSVGVPAVKIQVEVSWIVHHLHPEDGGRKVLRIAGILPRYHTASQYRRYWT
jgi:hypothetical protein